MVVSSTTEGPKEISMAKKSKTAEEIVQEQMPGWTIVKPSGPIKRFGASQRVAEGADAVATSVDAVMPSTSQLRSKFLGADAVADSRDQNADALDADVKLYDLKSGDLERTVAVNSRTQKIEWSQG